MYFHPTNLPLSRECTKIRNEVSLHVTVYTAHRHRHQNTQYTHLQHNCHILLTWYTVGREILPTYHNFMLKGNIFLPESSTAVLGPTCWMMGIKVSSNPCPPPSGWGSGWQSWPLLSNYCKLRMTEQYLYSHNNSMAQIGGKCTFYLCHIKTNVWTLFWRDKWTSS